jgi:hypothetical protein
MPDISRLVIEIDSKGVLKATGDLEVFSKMGEKAGKSTGGLADKMGALQLIASKLPGPLKSVAAGLMGMVNPSTAVVGAFLEIGEAAVRYVQESVNAFAKFETIKTSLEVVTGSADQASRMFNDLQRASSRTPFSLQQYSEVAVMLKQSGMAAKDLIPTLEMLGNVSGGSAEKFSRIATNFAQISNVGKATSMDLRQFAMAGVPIYKMLEDVGRKGENSFEAISEAIKKATGEGGAFYNAMGKGSKTLESMKSQLTSLKEQYKALWAEASGAADISKSYYEEQIKRQINLNDELSKQIELQDILDRKKDIEDRKKQGTSTLEDDYTTFEDEYRGAEIHIADLLSRIEKLNNYSGAYSDKAKSIIPELQRQLEIYTSIIDTYGPLINYDKQHTAALERQVELLNKIKSSYTNSMDFVNEVYEQTQKGQAEKIQEQIEKLENIRNNQMKVEKGRQFDSSTKTWKETEVMSYLGAEEIAKVDQALDYYKEKLKGLRAPFEDWVKILAQATGYTEEIVNNLGGLQTVEKYAAEVQSIQNTLLSQDGILIQALGLDELDVLESSADKVRAVLEAMLNSGKWNGTEDSVQRLIEILGRLDKTVSDSRFKEFMDELRKETEYLDMPPKEQAIHNTKELLKSKGIMNPTDEQAGQVLQATFERDEKKLQLQEESIWLSKEELRMRELIAQYGDEANAKAIYQLEQQIEKTQALKDALEQLKEAGLQTTASGLVDFAHDLGKAFQDGTVSSDEFSGAIGNMLKSLIDAMPQLLLNVGLQLISKGQWGPGLAFIGASGLMSFVSGMIDDAEEQSKRDEADRLNRIMQQITDLINAQKQQEEYYQAKKRHIDSTAMMNVNDAIITPRGIVNTHPEDYIIATKHPENLMNGSAAQVYVTIINNTSATVTKQESIDENGVRKLTVAIDNVINSGLASGRYDNAMNAMEQRRAGRRINT